MACFCVVVIHCLIMSAPSLRDIVRANNPRQLRSFLRGSHPGRKRLSECLLYAATNNYVCCLKILLEHGAHVNAGITGRGTALHAAASALHARSIKVLLDAGANPRARSIACDDTPLHMVISHHAGEQRTAAAILKCTRLLVKAGASVNARNANKETPLHYAVYMPHIPKYAVVTELLKLGAHINAKTNKGKTAMQYVFDDASQGITWNAFCAREVIRAFLDFTGLVDNEPETGFTLLHLSVIDCRHSLVRLLIQRGAKVQFKGKRSSLYISILTTAVTKNCTECARLLLEAGADPNVADVYDLTAPLLYFAIQHEQENMIELLLKHGADPNQITADSTCLFEAMHSESSTKILHTLLEGGLNPNLKNSQGVSSLSAAMLVRCPHMRVQPQMFLDVFQSCSNFVDDPLCLDIGCEGARCLKLLLQGGATDNPRMVRRTVDRMLHDMSTNPALGLTPAGLKACHTCALSKINVLYVCGLLSERVRRRHINRFLVRHRYTPAAVISPRPLTCLARRTVMKHMNTRDEQAFNTLMLPVSFRTEMSFHSLDRQRVARGVGLQPYLKLFSQDPNTLRIPDYMQ